MAEQKETSANVNIREVRNYEKALNFGVANLDDPKGLPLSLRLLKEMHRILMTDVRGGESLKTPGEFRRSQNWIGGENIQAAFFIPCSPETLDDHLANFEKAVHEDDLPVLIKAALLHYQFETIHPFNDGNGRIGRLLVTLYLIDKKLLNKPLLYLSLYFKAYKNQYYDILTHVRETGDYERWLTFFLKGVLQVSASIEKTTRQILSLKDGLKHTVKDTYNLIDFLFETPFVDADIIKKHAGISQGTCYKLIDSFEKQGILRQVSVGKRNRRYCFQSYIDLLSSAELGDEDY